MVEVVSFEQKAERSTWSISQMSQSAMIIPMHFGEPSSCDAVAPLACPRQTKPHGWGNQDLADFYRAQRLLAIAGIDVESDDGVTDEGDPWLVFIDDQGEVFAHFARIGDVYVLDSSAQDHVIEASSLRDLVDRFANAAQEKSSAARIQSGEVVSLGALRGTKIRMHPGAALAAMIWSILAFCDESTPPAAINLEDAAFQSPPPPSSDTMGAEQLKTHTPEAAEPPRKV